MLFINFIIQIFYYYKKLNNNLLIKLQMDNVNVPMKYKFETRIGNWNEES